MSDLARSIEQLSPAKRALLLQRLQEKQQASSPASAPASITRQDRGPGLVPLSYAQQRLWFLAQLEDESSGASAAGRAYILSAAFSLLGPLDAPALARSLRALMQRHESLRTRFVLRDDTPGQIIDTVHAISLPLVDLSLLPEHERQAEAQRLAVAESAQPFDLEHGPLLRARLLRLRAREHLFFLSLSHLVADGWSLAVFFRELSSIYSALTNGCDPVLPELPIQYADYTLWQRQWLSSSAALAQLAYWKQQLTAVPALALPTDHPRPAVQRFQGHYLRFRLSAEQSLALKQLSQQEGVTLFMTLLAALQVVLARYSGQEDIAIGTPVAGRSHSELEGLIGLFINTLVLRTDLSGNPNARELLQRARQVTLDAYARQDAPFEKLVEEVKPERSLSANPLFQVMLSWQNTPTSPLLLRGAQARQLPTERHTSMFDLTLNLAEGRDGVYGGIEYDRDLFEQPTIERFIERYQQVLAAMVAQPEQRLSQLPFLTRREQAQQRAWNATAVPYPQHVCLHQLCEQQVDRAPDATALSFENAQLSYQELNRRANQLARYLRRQGVGPETRVGVCLERSLELVISLLAILKAGGAYVPLDPDYPAERLAFMLADAQAGPQGQQQPQVLLTQQRLLPRLPAHKALVVVVDTGWQSFESELATNPVSGVTAAHLAYVIYTSGSTGHPKGAMLTHRGICNRLLWMQGTYTLSRVDRVLLKTPFSFDVSVWEFFWPLLAGAALVIARPGGHQDSSYLVEVIAQQQITTLHFVPSMLSFFLAEPALERCSCVQRVFCSGEALSAEQQARFFLRAHSGAELHNLYGPTEASVDVTFWRCDAADFGATVPIGRPIANTQIHLLDRFLNLVPVGVTGELYIGGVGLARGYLNRPQLTAEKFLPDPFSAAPGARLYRSGDLARYRPDGSIEFLGRIDFQVKLHGNRVELGEIEHALSRHPSVSEVVVLAREDAPGEQRLVAYVVSRTAQPLDLSQVRQYLQSRLPDFMFPSAVITLERLPLSANGKLDRKALPLPDTRRREAEPYTAPRTPVEEKLAELWAAVLRVQRASIHDNFFELGGDSILSLQLVARARQAGMHLTPKQIFQRQTIAELASVASADSNASAFDEQGLARGYVPLTPIQSWFFEQQLAHRHHFNQAVLLQTAPGTNPWYLMQALHHLALHHDALRLRFVHEQASHVAGEIAWLQFHAQPQAAQVFAWLHVDLAALPERERAIARSAVAAATQASLNMQQGPLARAVFFTAGAHLPARLLLVIHHLVIDAVSWNIILEDLRVVYEQRSQGTSMQLPARTTSFKAWAEHLQAHVRAHLSELRRDVPYWLELSHKRVPPIPVDYTAQANMVASERIARVTLSGDETRALLYDAPRAAAVTAQELLLTALLLTWARWTGESRLLVDIEAHGREALFEDVDLSRTAGWFTVIYPLLLEVDPAAQRDPQTALEAVKEQWRARHRRGINYGLLRYLSADTEVIEQLRAGPAAQLLFNYLGSADQTPTTQQRFCRVTEPVGQLRSPLGKRSHVLEVIALLQAEQLQVAWVFSEQAHRPSTIERLAQDFLQLLRELLAHCCRVGAGAARYTPSDFPLLDIDQEELDDMLAAFAPHQEEQ